MSVVCAAGDLDGETPARLYRLLADELAKEPAQLVLELAGATSIEDACVEAMVGASALAAASDTSFCLVASPNDPVTRALATADLSERFEVFPTVGEATSQR